MPGGRKGDTAQTRKRQKHRELLAVPTTNVPHELSVEQFAEARLREIALLEQSLNAEVTIGKRAFQTLPLYLRRRAMSHNRKRLPRRLRARAERELQQSQGTLVESTPEWSAGKRRAYRRRRHGRRKTLAERSRRCKRLETHVWHAKRMRMVERDGWVIPARPSDKSLRATYRAAAHTCAVQDISYYTCLQIAGSADDIISVVAPLCEHGDPALVGFPEEGAPVAEFPLEMVCHSAQARAALAAVAPGASAVAAGVGPVQAMWVPGASRGHARLWLWADPGVAPRLAVLLAHLAGAVGAACTVTPLTDMRRLRLRGPKAHPILRKTLLAADGCSAPEWETVSRLHSPGSVPAGVAIAMSVYDPRFVNHQYNRHNGETYAQLEWATAKPEWQAMLDALMTAWPASAAPAEAGIFAAAARMAATEARPRQRELDAVRTATMHPSPANLLAAAPDALKRPVPVLLVQQPSTLARGFAAGWDLLVPAGWAMPFLRCLVYAGARAVGEDNMHALATEQGLASFPHDYPDTQTYRTTVAVAAEAAAARHQRTPPSKRCNYPLLGSPHPFAPDWDALFEVPRPLRVLRSPPTLPAQISDPAWNTLLPVIAHTVRKGAPVAGAMICAPSKTDLQGFLADEDGWIAEEPLQTRFRTRYRPSPSSPSSRSQPAQPAHPQVISSRRIVGFLTSAMYSMVRGRALGVGAITVEAWENAYPLSASAGLLLFRNPKSRVYRPLVLVLQ